MCNSIELTVPKENANDSQYTLLAMYYKDGDNVKKDSTLAVFETSKTAFDFPSPSDGYISWKYSEGDTISVGDVFAIISHEPIAPTAHSKKELNLPDKAARTNNNIGSPRISEQARKLITENNIDITNFKHLEIVKRKDVIEHLKQKSKIEKTSEQET